MATVRRYVEVVLKAVDQTKGPVEGLLGGINKVKLAYGALIAASALAVGKIINDFNRAVNAAGQFQHKMLEVNTLLQASDADFQGLSSQIRDLSVQYGQLDKTMATASYNVVSAGFADISDQMGILKTASRAAIAGVTDVNTAAKAITQTINAYGKTAKDAGRISDILFATVKGGVTTFDELAQNMGAVNAIAAQAGLEFEEVAAALAVLTQGGLNTAEASTALKSLIVAVGAASGESKTKLDELGISLDQGLQPALVALAEAGEYGISALKEMIPNVRAVTAAASAGREGGKAYAEQLAATRKEAGQTDKAFEIMAESLVLAQNRFESAGRAIQTVIGSIGVEAKRDILNAFADAVVSLAKVIENNKQPLVDFANSLASIVTSAIKAGENLVLALPKFKEFFDKSLKFTGFQEVVDGFRSLTTSIKDAEEALARYKEEAATAIGPGTIEFPEFGISSVDLMRAQAQRAALGERGAVISAAERAGEERRLREEMFAAVPKEFEAAPIGIEWVWKPMPADDFVPFSSEEMLTYMSEQYAKQAEAIREVDEALIDMEPTVEELPEHIRRAAEEAEEMAAATAGVAESFRNSFSNIGGNIVAAFVMGQQATIKFSQIIQQLIATTLSELIRKLIYIKALQSSVGMFNPIGFLGFEQGGEIPRAQAGYVVPDIGIRGVDSVPVLAQAGEGVIRRHTMQRLERFLTISEQASAMGISGGGGGGGGDMHVHFNVARPVTRGDVLSMADATVEASRLVEESY